MRKRCTLLLLVVVLAGCAGRSSVGVPVDSIAVPYTGGRTKIYEYQHNGMPCLIASGPDRFGITCDWSKFDGYKAPDVEKFSDRGPVDWEAAEARIREDREAGRLVEGGFPHGFYFLRMQYLRGFENLMIDIATDEPRLRELAEMVYRFNQYRVDRQLAAGVDMMGFAEDLGTQTSSMISPVDFKKWVVPYYKRLMKPCRDAGVEVFLHCDGHIMEIMDDLIDCGVNFINPQDLVNGIDNLAKYVKGRIAIRLDIDRQKIVPFGTPAQIRELVEEEVRKLGSPRGGLSLSAGIYPPTPPENIEALCCAMDEFRTYWWDGRAL